jgi:hypothetical protein
MSAPPQNAGQYCPSFSGRRQAPYARTFDRASTIGGSSIEGEGAGAAAAIIVNARAGEARGGHLRARMADPAPRTLLGAGRAWG